MNQPNSPIATVRTSVSQESPDVLAVLRRYVWLLIGGAVAGAAISGGMFTYFNHYMPQYTARVKFQVSTPPSPIGGDQQGVIGLSTDDTSQIIHRQMDYFDYDPFLTEIITDADFRQDHDNPGKLNSWMQKYGPDLKQLRKDLRVEPKVSSATFDLTMTTGSRMDSYYMVLAAQKVYKSFLEAQSAEQKQSRSTNLSKALKDAEDKYKFDSDKLQSYAEGHGIDVMKSRFEIEKSELQQLNELGSSATAEASASDGLFKALQEQEADAKTKSQSDPTVEWYERFKLAPDMEQYIENDATLRQLQDQRLAWEQEMAGKMAAGSTTTPQGEKEMQGRMHEIDRQIGVQQNKLTQESVERMVARAQNEATGKQELAKQFDGMRSKEEDIVRQIGMDLMSYQQQVDDLKDEGEWLTKLRTQYALEDANKYSDDTRVQNAGDNTVPPGDISWPKWYVFLPIGTMAGLGISALLAYLLVLTDTRVRTPRDISKTLQLPMLGFVPDETDDRSLNSSVETAITSSPMSMVAEQFRQIRNHITAQTAHAPVNTLLVASITPGGGATTTAANLAAAMALNEMRVLLVDANFYRPRLSGIFKDLPTEGLTEALQSPGSPSAFIVPHPTLARLHLMNSGHNAGAANSELFNGKQFRELLDQLKSQYDLIIFDGAPLNLVSDSLALAARVDGVVSVVRAGEVSRGAVSRVRDQLRGVHANLLGFVLNAVQTSNTGYFKENYRSFYRYAVKDSTRSSASH